MNAHQVLSAFSQQSDVVHPSQSFWRHRSSWHYIYQHDRLQRCSDGETIGRGADGYRLGKRLEKKGATVLWT